MCYILPAVNRIEEATFVIFDTETASALNGRPGRICEVGAIKTREEAELDRFHSLVNPQEPISPDATRIHGITDDAVQSAPPFPALIPPLREFIRGGILVAHNTAFDIQVLNLELRRADQRPWQGASIDTVRLARKAFQGLPSYGLDGLADFMGLQFRERHRSIGDCEVTVQVFWRCVRRLKEIGRVGTLTDLLEAGRNRAAERAE